MATLKFNNMVNNGPFNKVQIYVSGAIGNDANSGSYGSPLRTFGAAITLAASHAGCTIICLDSNSYNENITMTTIFNIYAPNARLSPSSGDAITCQTASSNPSITFKDIIIGSGSCLNVPGGFGSGNIYLNVEFMDGTAGAAVYNAQNGNVYINAEIINGSLLTGGSGNNYYYSKTRSGSDSAQTFGQSFPLTPPGISTINVQTFTSNGTYTPTPGMSHCIVECVGGGGGGGGVTSAAGSSAAAGGGGGGAYAKSVLSAATIGASQAVTIGTGGSGGAAGNNNGANGSASSLGILVEADGGSGGLGASASASFGFGVFGAGGGSGVGQLVVNGNEGTLGLSFGANLIGLGGPGGNSFYGVGGAQLVNQAGQNGYNYGSGGSGASSANTGAVAGGNGMPGIVIVTEYIS